MPSSIFALETASLAKSAVMIVPFRILILVTASLAKSAVTIEPFSILALVTASFAIVKTLLFCTAVTSPVNAALSKLLPFNTVEVEPV